MSASWKTALSITLCARTRTTLAKDIVVKFVGRYGHTAYLRIQAERQTLLLQITMAINHPISLSPWLSWNTLTATRFAVAKKEKYLKKQYKESDLAVLSNSCIVMDWYLMISVHQKVKLINFDPKGVKALAMKAEHDIDMLQIVMKLSQ